MARRTATVDPSTLDQLETEIARLQQELDAGRAVLRDQERERANNDRVRQALNDPNFRAWRERRDLSDILDDEPKRGRQ